MKKIFCWVTIVFLAMAGTAWAEADWLLDPVDAGSAVDNLEIGKTATADGFCSLTVTEFSFQDRLGYYQAGSKSVGSSEDYYLSGDEAEYAVLKADIANAGTEGRDFLSGSEVRMYYGVSTYGGWAYQQNPDNGTSADISFGVDSGMQNVNWVINSTDNYAVEPDQVGHYVFGCTLPNEVVDDDGELRMVITIDGNEFTYYVRTEAAEQLEANSVSSRTSNEGGFAFIPATQEDSEDSAPMAEETPIPTPELTPEPTPAPTPEPTITYVKGVSGDSNVRTGPGLSYDSIGALKKGQSAEYLDESSIDDRGVAWYCIYFNGRNGWVSSKYTELSTGMPTQQRAAVSDDKYDLSNFGYREVEINGSGTLVFQREPSGEFMSGYSYRDGEQIYVNLNWRQDGYTLAYDSGVYGYVDVQFIDWGGSSSGQHSSQQSSSDLDYAKDLSNYDYRMVDSQGRGSLVFQKEPRGKSIKGFKYHDGDWIYVNVDWRKEGYAMAYEDGTYGYVDASYIDW